MERSDTPPAIADALDPGTQAPTLIVLIAGAYDAPDRFVEHGFVRACRERRVAADLLMLPTDLDEVARGTMSDQLHHRVIAPERAAGRQRIVLCGISIGAMVALIHEDCHPGLVDRIVLLAPYLGNRAIVGAVAGDGGLAAWRPGALSAEQGELRAWRALQRSAARRGPPVWLGHGTEDRFANVYDMIAEALPGDAVDAIPGDHDWDAWRSLWPRFLDRVVMP